MSVYNLMLEQDIKNCIIPMEAKTHEYFGSIGMNIPIAGSAMIDLALQAGIRGKSAIVEEQFLRFGFSISAGEIWFKPFPRE